MGLIHEVKYVCLVLLCFSISVEGSRIAKQIKSETFSQLMGINSENRNETLLHLVHLVQLQNASITQGVLDAIGKDEKVRNELVLLFITDLAESTVDEFDGKLESLQLLFNLQPELIEAKLGEHKGTLLQHVAEQVFSNGRQLETIHFLIENNANLSGRDHHNATVLHWAVRCNSSKTGEVISMIKLLIESGAEPNAVNEWGQTFVHHATCKASPQVFHEILSYLASIGDTNSFTMRDKEGAQVLHLAVFYYEYLGNDTLQILKSNGVDFNAKQNNNFDVLTCATSGTQNVTFLENLIAFGANWNRMSEQGDNLLQWAAYNGNLPAFEFFLDLGIGVNSEDNDGRTGMNYAIMNGQNATFIKSMIEFGARWKIINRKHKEGGLHYAAWMGNLPVVKLFISLGAGVNAKDNFGETPLHYVFLPKIPEVELGESVVDIINVLTRNGANANIKNSYGELPVDLARNRISDKKLKRRVVNLLMRRMGRK